jgi:hypothetical protein
MIAQRSMRRPEPRDCQSRSGEERRISSDKHSLDGQLANDGDTLVGF